MRQSVTPTQHDTRSPLLQHTTSRASLMSAWLDVKPRVINSKDAEVRTAAGVFARDITRSISALQRELRSGTFKFDPQRGVLKRKHTAPGEPKKEPRPIVVSPVRNRIVQRAILDTCQSDVPRIKRRLGTLPDVIATKTSVGGLPGRGVPEAIGLISHAITGGAKWYVRSDLKKFFQAIPKKSVDTFLRENIRESRFVKLFMQALETELSNEAEVRQMIDLFPIGDIGVPQGSALSALCANIVLAGFDQALNGRGIVTVRYLDDFVILGPTKQSVLKAWARAQDILNAIGFDCHDPTAETGKASRGEIVNGFHFLSFYIDDQNLYPSVNARNDFLDDLRLCIRNAKSAIMAVKNEPRRAEPRFIQSLNLMDRKIRGWGDAFSATTKRVVLAQLDQKIHEMVESYLKWFGRIRRNLSRTREHRMLGIALLSDTPAKNLSSRA